MPFIETLCVLSLLFTTSCQFNSKLATPKDEMYGDGTKLFIHHQKNTFNDNYDVYLDNQKIDPKVLDRNGVRLSKGKHGLDVVEKNASSKRQHFDIEIRESNESHYNLCIIRAPAAAFALEKQRDPNNMCIESPMN